MMSSAALFFMTTFITLSCYFIGLMLFQKFNKSWLNPLYSSTVLIITLLNFLHIDVKSYTSGSGIFTAMLGTATVSLAIPLYKQYDTIKKYLSIIAFAVIPGTLIGVVSVVLLTKLLHLNHEIMSSMIPKSVTAPIALTISQAMGGIPSLTFLFIIISAVFSITTGPFLLKCTRIRSRIAKGLALGTSAQAIGASRAFEWGELEGTMGSIAMISSALTLSLITPFLINFFLF